MKLLVIAYEFPPILSGQSIRWCHLANEMSTLGADVHVLAPRFPDRHTFRYPLNDGLVIHRTSPGPFIELSARLATRVRPGWSSTAGNVSPETIDGAESHSLYDMLESAYRHARTALDQVLFPDVRSEWFPSAWAALQRLVPRHDYDVIVSSHEPGVTLLLGLRAQKRWKRPWLVDMGDPFVGPRTPRWRRRLDLAAERIVCQRADRLVVTCPEMLDLLAARHHSLQRELLADKLSVVTQGFPVSTLGEPVHRGEERGRKDFVLLFTGTFNSPLRRVFRAGGELAAALRSLSFRDLRLVLAGAACSGDALSSELGDRVHALGMIDHLQCLSLQRRATVLLNVANDNRYQVPGKVFEYLGANRPILHLTVGEQDPAADLLRRLRRGLVIANERAAIAKALRLLHTWWQEGILESRFDLSPEAVREFAWPSLARRFLRECEHARTVETQSSI